MGASLRARDIGLAFGLTSAAAPLALDVEVFQAEPGELVGITGPSGSGKTSLLYALAGLERPQRGFIRWDGVDILSLSEASRDRWRRRTLGFVFQDFQLFPGMTAIGNVLLPATFAHAVIPARVRERARALLAEVKIPDERRPVSRLARGEMQRVALARALLLHPSVVLADEPTASLDAESGAVVADLLVSMARDAGSTAIVVSHDRALLARLDRVETLVGGRVMTPAMITAVP